MLFIAAQNGHMRILEVLLEHGAKVDAARTDGATPLWIAAQMGHDHVVRRLLKADAKVDATRHVSVARMIEHGAGILIPLSARSALGVTRNAFTYNRSTSFCRMAGRRCSKRPTRGTLLSSASCSSTVPSLGILPVGTIELSVAQQPSPPVLNDGDLRVSERRQRAPRSSPDRADDRR